MSEVTKIDKNSRKLSYGQAVLDAWKNVITGLGSLLKDKRMSSTANFSPLRDGDAEELYASDDVAAKVVDGVPDDGLRMWGTFHAQGDETFAKVMADAFDVLQVRAKVREGWKWGRLYGGAALLMVVDDSQNLSLPLRPEAIREFKSLVPLTRYELIFHDLDLDLTSTRYGQPLTYSLQPHRGAGDVVKSGQLIHHSRLLIFDGVRLPPRLYVSNGYWHDSVLTRAENAIRNYSTSHDAAATIMQEFNQGVFKMKGLAQLMANGKATDVANRLEMLNISRGICRALVIDMDEEFKNEGAALTGAPDMLKMIGGRLVAASNMPHTKILGESPSGLGATGKSEKDDWDDFVANEQEMVALPLILRLAELVMLSKRGPTKGKVPVQWGFEFDSLRQLTEIEQAELRNKQAQTDKIYVEASVVDADELANCRFGSGKYSAETQIDLKARDRRPAPVDPQQTQPPGKKPEGGAA